MKKNLTLAYPDITSENFIAIEKGTYRYFSRLIAESIKSINLHPTQIKERVHVVNEQLLEQYRKQHRNVIVVTAHYGNWEWAAQRLGQMEGFKTYSFYRPLSNKGINRLLAKSRSNTGTQLIAEKESRKLLRSNHKAPLLVAMLGDQSPVNVKTSYWTHFMHQDTAMVKGPEKMAKLLDAIVVYAEIIPTTKLGYYEVWLTTLTDQPKLEAENSITEKYLKMMETTINNAPIYWLWTHNRWKRSHLKPTSKDN